MPQINLPTRDYFDPSDIQITGVYFNRSRSVLEFWEVKSTGEKNVRGTLWPRLTSKGEISASSQKEIEDWKASIIRAIKSGSREHHPLSDL